MQDHLTGEVAVHSGRRLTASPTKRVADVLVDVLRSHGVDAVFGLPGGTIAPINDALLDQPDIRLITSRHEGSAVFAAAGYARTSGRLGVVAVTSGPGILNAVNGIASAYCDGLPVLVLAGEVPRALHGKGALQEGSAHHLNIVQLTRHVTKLALEVPSAQAAPAHLRRAIATTLSGKPGPVVLTLPLDVLRAEIHVPNIEMAVSTRFELQAPALEKAALELLSSKRTVIFAGSGVRNGDGARALREFAEHTQTPVMTTPKGKAVFPENHPLSLGVFGLAGHPSTKAYLAQGIDVMLAVGTSLGDLATDGWSELLRPRQALIQVDVDVTQIGRNYAVQHGLVGPASDVLRALRQVLPKADEQRMFGPTYQTDPELDIQDAEGRITPQRAIWEIQRAMPKDTIFVIDSGEHFLYAAHYLKLERSDSFVAMTGLGSMGSSIGAALGAKLAKPHRHVAVIMGDGGFAMVGTELSVAVQEGIPITVFVLNDGRLAMCEIGDKSIFGRTRPWNIDMQIERVADALGTEARLVQRPGDLPATISADGQRAPLVFDIRVARRAHIAKSSRLEMLSGQRRGPPSLGGRTTLREQPTHTVGEENS